jgi:hypothetical protein
MEGTGGREKNQGEKGERKWRDSHTYLRNGVSRERGIERFERTDTERGNGTADRYSQKWNASRGNIRNAYRNVNPPRRRAKIDKKRGWPLSQPPGKAPRWDITS